MRRVAAALLAIAALVAGCTGVPTSSSPETVQALNTDGAGPSRPVPPSLDAGPRDLVYGFLSQNASNTGNHNAAREYLTSAASNQWSDATATIVGDDFSVGTYNARRRTVTVYARVLGALNQNGIYTPSLLGIGSGGDKQAFVFAIARVGKGYRISNLRSGVLLTDNQFHTTYQQRVIYFFDAAQRFLVPDLRWSALDDRTQLAEWLLAQLVDGPRPELQSAVSPDSLPAQADARQLTVELGSPTRIEIPGSSQLEPAARNRLAAQLSETLLETLAGREMTITDNGSPVVITAAVSDRFTAADFAADTGPPAPESKVYYLAGGRIHDDSGDVLSGAAGTVALSSVAVSRAQPAGPLLIAGVEGSGADERLVVGTVRRLRETTVHGELTRPAFVPGRNEVLVGSGSELFRVAIGSGRPRAGHVPIRAVPGGGRILALRVSPESSRIAMTVSGASGSAQLYVGSIVRTANSESIGGLVPISPQGVVVTDVAWLDSFKLFAIGYLSGSLDSKTFEAGVDGTEWTNEDVGLPSPPDSVTAATASSVWVSANDYVWKQSGNSWVSPSPTGQTPGTAPVYLE